MQLLQPSLDTIDPSPGVRLVGVAVSNLGPVHHHLTLAELDGPEHGVREVAVDEIRERFGTDATGRVSAVRDGRVRNVKRGVQQWGPDE